ncbi:MAG: DUF5666 domain-containing protein [Candidatus Omnitrophota bacterium]|jgi:putative copper export protein
MKRFLIIFLVLGLSAGLTFLKLWPVNAQENMAVETAKVAGKIVAVDLDQSTITVQAVTSGSDQEVSEVVLGINNSTVIDKSAETISIKELTVGNVVEVRYQVSENGALTAQNVWVY